MTTHVAGDLHCSFCNKSQRDVSKVIAGPGVYICNECVDLCIEIMGEELRIEQVHDRITSPDAEPPRIRADLDVLPDAELMDLMVRIHSSHAGVDRTVQRLVAVLRERNVSWARIGEALGMTRQSAWERFSGEE